MISYYRKYRPQKVRDLDIEAVRSYFEIIRENNSFSHAYLFHGPKGTGKTSAARILAKLINCEKRKKGEEPCGKCANCQRIETGASLSVVEMDAASNRGIDDIRALRDRINLAPAEGSHIVYIIDEAHMLTNEAFNALLKTLEEPPAHAVFVLATTEPHKLPETVISRCVDLSFNKASTKEVVRSLKKAVKGEGLNIDDKSLENLADSVDGSFRDGMKILEVLSQSGKRISQKSVEEIIGKTKAYDVDHFISLLKEKKVKELLTIISQNEKSGVNPAIFITRLTQNLRNQMLYQLSQGNREKIEQNIELINLFQDAANSLKTAVYPTLPLEIAVAKYCLTDSFDKPDKASMEESKTNVEVIRTTKPAQAEPLKGASSQPKKNYKNSSISLNQIASKWDEILSGVKPFNHSLEALLRSTRPIECDGAKVTIEVFYQFHKDQLEQDRHRRQIEQVISDIFDLPAQLYFTLGEKKPIKVVKKGESIENVSGKLKDEDLAQAAEEIFGS